MRYGELRPGVWERVACAGCGRWMHARVVEPLADPEARVTCPPCGRPTDEQLGAGVAELEPKREGGGRRGRPETTTLRAGVTKEEA